MAGWMRIPAAVVVALAIAPATASGAGAAPAQIAPVWSSGPAHRSLRQRAGAARSRESAPGTTRVAFALIRHTGAGAGAPATGTVAYNPGGPGAAAIVQAPGVAVAFAPLLTAGYDLLLVDPRGTGDSDAISCPALADPGLAFAPRERFAAAIGACGTQLGARAGQYGAPRWPTTSRPSARAWASPGSTCGASRTAPT
jgi:hypothetical protein